MIEIPKRPEWAPCITPEEWQYEHAVAKVAVEALRDANCACQVERNNFDGPPEQAPKCSRCEALAKIEASGWKP